MANQKSNKLSRPRPRPGGERTGQRADVFAPFSDADATRIAACYGLLSRAAYEIGIKAEGSSKLTRALEDVAAVRDALGEITGRIVAMAIIAPIAARSPASTDARTIQTLVFAAEASASRNWDDWRRRELLRRSDES